MIAQPPDKTFTTMTATAKSAMRAQVRGIVQSRYGTTEILSIVTSLCLVYDASGSFVRLEILTYIDQALRPDMITLGPALACAPKYG